MQLAFTPRLSANRSIAARRTGAPISRHTDIIQIRLFAPRGFRRCALIGKRLSQLEPFHFAKRIRHFVRGDNHLFTNFG